MAVVSADRTVIGVFRSMDDAQRAFDALQKEGFSRDEISFIANKNASESWGGSDARTDTGDTASDIAADAGIGAALGGVGGLLLSFAGLAIPGIGPVLAAGPILAALGGAGIGAAAGGLIGALTESGIPHEHAEHYAESVRRGDILLTVRADQARADRAAEILDDNGAVDIDRRVSEWRERGWESHDANAEPLSSDELNREREYYRAADEQGDRWQEQARHNTGMGSGPGAGLTDYSSGTPGVTTGTGPGRMVGTEAGLGTGPGTLGDRGQQRGTAPAASAQGGSLTGAEAHNARQDAARSSETPGQESRAGTREAQFHQDTAEDVADRATSRPEPAGGHGERRAARIYEHVKS